MVAHHGTISDPEPWQTQLVSKRVLVAIALAGVVGLELQTSWLQSKIFAAAARRITYSVEPGPSPSIRYPRAAPYDQRLGYAKLPEFLPRLNDAGFDIQAQARSSEFLIKLMEWGIFPIYREKSQAGLHIFDRSGQPLFSRPYPVRTYERFDDIPPLVWKTLLFIEDRELVAAESPYRNPAVEWDRLANAVFDLSINAVDSEHPISGGSTLATQLEKIRHSPGGRTSSVAEKLRQMLAASLRAYQDGVETVESRKRIVRDFVNSMPLAAIGGYGEVTGIGDGLWAWFGADFDTANQLLSDSESTARAPIAQGQAYRRVVALLLAVNRPSYYLRSGQADLEDRTDSYLHLLAEANIISPYLRDSALLERLDFRNRAPLLPGKSAVERKAIDSVRADLLWLLGLDHLYDLDRLDLKVTTTLDNSLQRGVSEELTKLQDPQHAAEAGLVGRQLLGPEDPEGVVYSFTLYERSEGTNVLRVQADNFDQPLNINQGTKLELGSTAKLRTLATYLEIVAKLHERLFPLSPEELTRFSVWSGDSLTRWTVEHLSSAEDRSLPAMLEVAMNRPYSASPAERFFTGAGLHRFNNFDAKDNRRVMPLREGFRRSVNLVFIRLMRDIVNYYKFRVTGASPEVLEDVNHPQRKDYLQRFADFEGRDYLSRFYHTHSGRTTLRALEVLAESIRATPLRLAVIHRSVLPAATLEEFAEYLRSSLPDSSPSPGLIADLYESYAPGNFSLSDRGYLSRIHPLELWVGAYLARHPEAKLSEVFAVSEKERQEVYTWLFRTRNKRAQNTRIRIAMENDAFREIHKSWRRQGYPFGSLVPSYASAIGSSGDRPTALAELVGIILNDGLRYPSVRVRELQFADGTPIETLLGRRPSAGVRALPSAVAAALKHELIGVVEHGTGRRASGAVVFEDGSTLAVGGKTGTGDNCFKTFSDAGYVIGSRAINRTATFVFLIGDRFFGTITAYVPGPESANYRFTSALPVQIFKHLLPMMGPLLQSAPTEDLVPPAETHPGHPADLCTKATRDVEHGRGETPASVFAFRFQAAIGV